MSGSNFGAHYHVALRWLRRNIIEKSWIPVSSGRNIPYPEVTGYFIPTLLECGCTQEALDFARWLITIQNTDGSWPDPSRKMPYTFDTGQVIRGLLSVLTRLPEVEEAIHRGCEWLLAQIQSSGRITTPSRNGWRLPGGQMVSESIHLYALEPLLIAGKLLSKPTYIKAVNRALDYYKALPDLVCFNTLSHFHAYVLEALVDLGYCDLARKGMAEVERLQREDGSVPAYLGVNWVCSTGLAQYTIIWYKLGQRKLAERALEYLCRIQNSSGGFYGSYGRGANYFPNEEISWAVKFFLDAYQWHIRTAFDANVALFPDRIEENDGRFQAVLRWMNNFSNFRVLDAGCGKGRFALLLQNKYPSAEIWGVDISDKMLSYIPLRIKTRRGSLLNLPFKDSYFDYAYCVEALEHSVNPEAAVRELCRVVKPGGRIIIVDKNKDHQGTFEIEEWEQWFRRGKLETWLDEYCTAVSSQPISYGNTVEPDGLFIAWHGIRR